MPALTRRRLLGAGLAAAAGAALGQSATGHAGRAVIVGGGWGGLTAARQLRRLAPEIDVSLVEPAAAFRSLPMSNAWLVDRAAALPMIDYAAIGRVLGYRVLRARATELDRDRRQLATTAGVLAYDWLVLAPGIRYDYAGWTGDDANAAGALRERYPAGFVASELEALKAKLAGFQGGDLLMTVPPGPSRCPPAPFERALLIAWWLKTRRIKGRLLLVDAGGGMQRFNRIFEERYKDQIEHLTHATVKHIDPFSRTLSTEFDELRFDDAIVIPPQGAGDILGVAGLLEPGGEGRPGGWAAFDPLHLNVPGDERVFVVGDALGRASPLFGPYPKSAHIASRLGRFAAAVIAARARGLAPPLDLPESVCHVLTSIEPPESMRVDATYRRRGDGLIVQTVRQHFEPQPRGEDLAWVAELRRELFGEHAP